MKKSIRTPDHCFSHLADYPFDPNYLIVNEGFRMHYVDEGDKDKPIILLLHGEPSWSYLYRKMIISLASDFRVIAPDLIGFGKSDKLTNKSDYSYQFHIDTVKELIERLSLDKITLFCQDWGGLIGLRIITQLDHLFSMVIASNTFLPTGSNKIPESFLQWRDFSQHSSSFDIAKVIDMGTIKNLSDEAMMAYNAPFPSEEYKAGARIFPQLVPIEKEDPEAIKNAEAWQVLKNWQKPFLTIFGSKDPIMSGLEKIFQKLIPGCQNQNHSILEAGHFIQEEKGEELSDLIKKFYQRNINH